MRSKKKVVKRKANAKKKTQSKKRATPKKKVVAKKQPAKKSKAKKKASVVLERELSKGLNNIEQMIKDSKAGKKKHHPRTGDPNSDAMPGLPKADDVRKSTPKVPNRIDLARGLSEGEATTDEIKFLEEVLDPKLSIPLSKNYQAYRNGFIASRELSRPQGVPKESVEQYDVQTTAYKGMLDRAYVLGHEGDRKQIATVLKIERTNQEILDDIREGRTQLEKLLDRRDLLKAEIAVELAAELADEIDGGEPDA